MFCFFFFFVSASFIRDMGRDKFIYIILILVKKSNSHVNSDLLESSVIV